MLPIPCMISGLRTWIGARLVLPATQIDPQKPFSDFGVDSLTAVELSVALGDWLKTELPTTLTWDFPNIRALATGVATPAKTPTPAAAPAPALPPARTDAVPDLEKLSEADMVQLLAAELATLRSEPTSRR